MKKDLLEKKIPLLYFNLVSKLMMFVFIVPPDFFLKTVHCIFYCIFCSFTRRNEGKSSTKDVNVNSSNTAASN